MNFPKFLPVVIEIVIECDGCSSFICRNSNGVVMQILHESSAISSFVDELCSTLVEPGNVVLSEVVKHNFTK